MEDCDLHAIVGGYGGRGEISANMTDMENISRSYSNLSNKPADKLVCCFTQIYEFTMGLDEHSKQPYRLRSFSPVPSPLSTQTIDSNSVPLPNEKTVSGKSPGVLPDFERINKPKKGKKNQNKNVVKHVTAEGPRSDAWAWRKYGQKPIKGSPYPRSYYRCSSSKGCSARKQVERSSLDPAVFVVTYTAEHSHLHPTRKNSSSGSTRKKRSPTTSASPDSTDEKGAEPQSYVEWVPSPNAETAPVIDNVLVDKEMLKNEGSRVMYDGENFNFMHETDAYVDDGWFQSIEEVNSLAPQLLSVDDYFMYQIYDLPKS